MASHHESITIQSFTENSNSRGVRVSLETEAVFPDATSSNINSNNDIPLLLNSIDEHLQSILAKFQLDSLTISISQSSDDAIRVLDNNDVDSFYFKKTFPVGTAIQYQTKEGIDSLMQEELDENENNFVRSLSRSGLLCQNIQMNNVFKSLPWHYPNDDHHMKNKNRIIMIPNDAFSLCHTKTLYQMITSASPCHDKYGAYSKLVYESLNDLNVFDKAVWMNIGYNESNDIHVQWGLRYYKQFYTESVSLMDIMTSTNAMSSKNKAVEGENTFQSCPMTESSKMVIRNSDSSKEIDLHENPIDMKSELINLSLKEKKEEACHHIGVERQILRHNGIAHYGTFQSRIFYSDNLSCDSGTVNVNLLDYYPKVVKPLFHTLKVFLIGELDGARGITQLDLFNHTQHHLSLAPDGSSTFALNLDLPPKSSLNIQIDYEPMFLPFQLFPADPNRGFDIPPSFVFFTLHNCPSVSSISSVSSPNSSCNNPVFALYSNSLLVMPPVPDMSMPFNVISLCGTCLAILVGTTINLIIKKSSQSVSDALQGVKSKSPIQKLKEKVKLKAAMLKEKLGSSKKNILKLKQH